MEYKAKRTQIIIINIYIMKSKQRVTSKLIYIMGNLECGRIKNKIMITDSWSSNIYTIYTIY